MSGLLWSGAFVVAELEHYAQKQSAGGGKRNTASARKLGLKGRQVKGKKVSGRSQPRSGVPAPRPGSTFILVIMELIDEQRPGQFVGLPISTTPSNCFVMACRQL